jgi:hypothetical protein
MSPIALAPIAPRMIRWTSQACVSGSKIVVSYCQQFWWKENVGARNSNLGKANSSSRTLCSQSGGFQKQPGYNAGEKKTGPPIDPKAKMGVAFTCKDCNTRVARFFSKISYERGVVIIKVTEQDGCTVSSYSSQLSSLGPSIFFQAFST